MSVFRRTYRDGSGALVRAQTWTIQFRDHRGARRRAPAGKGRRAAESLERRILRLVEAARAGEPPPWDDACALREAGLGDRLSSWGLLPAGGGAFLGSLDGWLDAWERAMQDRGSTAAHARQQAERVRGLVARLTRVTLTGEAVQGAARRLGAARGWTPATEGHYIGAARSWGRWLAQTGRVDADPLVRCRTPKAGGDARRRALSEDEVSELLRAAEESTRTFQGLDGPRRALLYRMALETGLRARELAGLTIADLDIGTEPSVRVRAASAKNRKGAKVPLRAETAALLAQICCLDPAQERDRAATLRQRPFPLGPSPRFAELLRRDLDAAGIPHEDAQGRRVDFHALRHTFITRLARAGVPVHVAQRLARHSTPYLTLAVYTHVSAEEERAAVEGLPGLGNKRRRKSRRMVE